MNETDSVLLGTPVTVTVFVVDYQYIKPQRKHKLPKTAKVEEEKVQNRLIVTSGDPSGRDVFEIAKRCVLGAKPYEGSDFRVLMQQRMVDAMGLAMVTSWAKLDGQAPAEVGVEIGKGEPSDEGGVPPVSSLN